MIRPVALLNSLVESLPTARLLLLVNLSSGVPAWLGKTSYAQLATGPVAGRQCGRVVAGPARRRCELATAHPPAHYAHRGESFFPGRERTLVETGVLGGKPGAYYLEHTLPTIQVPATVQAVLAARIDRLPPEEKRLLQTAAVIGYSVPLPLVQAIAALPEADLHRGLAHLQAAEFLYETRLFPEREFTFKHALTYEVAYGSLLRSGGAPSMPVSSRPWRRSPRPGRRAGGTAGALRPAGRGVGPGVGLLPAGGEKAMARSAHREAVGLEQALSALSHLPETRATREQAIDLRLALRSALFPLGTLNVL